MDRTRSETIGEEEEKQKKQKRKEEEDVDHKIIVRCLIMIRSCGRIRTSDTCG